MLTLGSQPGGGGAQGKPCQAWSQGTAGRKGHSGNGERWRGSKPPISGQSLGDHPRATQNSTHLGGSGSTTAPAVASPLEAGTACSF